MYWHLSLALRKSPFTHLYTLLINKKGNDLSLVLYLVKLMHFSLFEYNFVYLSLAYRTKRYRKYQNIHYTFSLLGDFLRAWLIFTTWQAIPFKRKFYLNLIWQFNCILKVHVFLTVRKLYCKQCKRERFDNELFRR